MTETGPAAELAGWAARLIAAADTTAVANAQNQLDELRLRVESATPGNPAGQGWSSYAQCDEDGIIRNCLNRIERSSPLSRTFIEIGCGNGLENNTHQLLLDGFRGGWLDGDQTNVTFIRRSLAPVLEACDRLTIRQVFVGADNVAEEVEAMLEFLGTRDIDFFSLDTDGNDVALVVECLKVFRPKLLCVEYNAKFRPPTQLVMSYNPQHNWAGDDYFGGSLQSWVDTLDGYSLVSCNLSGANAFFVREDLLGEFEHYGIDELYQPPRYWLASRPAGHPSGFRWLRQSLGYVHPVPDPNSPAISHSTGPAASDSADLVTLLYEAVFGRAPDPAGLAWWSKAVDDGIPARDLIAALISGDESNLGAGGRRFFSRSGR